MNKKIIFLLIILIAFYGCIKQETPQTKEYKIELNSFSFDFDNKQINLKVYSDKETDSLIEIFDQQKELLCFDYFELKKQENDILINCPKISKNLLIEITPSDAGKKRFNIEIELKEKITLKKGFKYFFKSKYTENNISKDHNIFITDENKNFIKGIAYSFYGKKEWFSVFLIDKNNLQVYSSNSKNNCFDAYSADLEKNNDGDESMLLFPFIFYYYQNNNEFKLNEFIVKKQYYDKELETEYILNKKIILNGREVYEITSTPMNANYYVQTENPFIVIYYKSFYSKFEFKEEIKEEFNWEKYNCFGD